MIYIYTTIHFIQFLVEKEFVFEIQFIIKIICIRKSNGQLWLYQYILVKLKNKQTSQQTNINP